MAKRRRAAPRHMLSKLGLLKRYREYPQIMWRPQSKCHQVQAGDSFCWPSHSWTHMRSHMQVQM